MNTIKNGQTQMRPKSYYSALSALLIVTFALLSFVAVWLTSVMSFWARILIADGPAYGAKRNLADSMALFPWWALILGFVSIAGIVYLVKTHGHLYKIKNTYLVALVVALFVGIGFALSFTPLPELLTGNHQSNIDCSSSIDGCNGTGRMNGRTR